MPDPTPAPAQHAATAAQIAELRAVAPRLDTIEGAMVRMLLAAYDAAVAERDQYAAVVRAARALCSCTGPGQYVEYFDDLQGAVAALPGETPQP